MTTRMMPLEDAEEIARLRAELKATRKRELALRRDLTSFAKSVRSIVDSLDAFMEKRKDGSAEDRVRGRAVADALNALELAHDLAWRFGLGNRLRPAKAPRRA